MKRNYKLLIGVLILVGAISCSVLYFHSSPTTLRIGIFAGSNWGVPSGNSTSIIDEAIDRFESKHTNVKIEYVSGIRNEDYSNWLSAQALSGDMPDVFMVLSEDLLTFAQTGILQDLDGFIKKDNHFDSEKYFTPSYASGTIDKVQYALPYESVPTLMFVNKTLLLEAGLDMPKDDWTWDDFYSICQTMTRDTDGDGKFDQFGQYGYTWQDAIASNNASVFDEEGNMATLEDEKVYDAIEFMRKLTSLNQNETVTSTMFDEGKVVFCPMQFSEYRTYKPYPWSVKKYSEFEWDCIPMPAGNYGNNVSMVDTLSVGMNRYSSQKELAWEFLKMLSYDETTQENLLKNSQGASVLKSVTTSTALKTALQDDTPGENEYNLDFFQGMMENAIPVKEFNNYDQAMTIANSEIQLLINSQKEIEIAMKSLNNDLNTLLDARK